MQKQEEVLKEKALHNELMKKGVDFVAEMHLGDAPPQEFVVKNLKYDIDDYRRDFNSDYIVGRA